MLKEVILFKALAPAVQCLLLVLLTVTSQGRSCTMFDSEITHIPTALSTRLPAAHAKFKIMFGVVALSGFGFYSLEDLNEQIS